MLPEYLEKPAEARRKREEDTFRLLLAEYRRLEGELDKIYQKFDKELEAERIKRNGKRVPDSWLKKDGRLTKLKAAVKDKLEKFGKSAQEIIKKNQQAEIDSQKKTAEKYIKLLGIKEKPKFPLKEMKNGAGKMGNGNDIAHHFSGKLTNFVLKRIENEALNSVKAETGSALKNLKNAHGPLLGRTFTTARTETMRAGRETGLRIFKQNVFDGWIWHSQLGPKTCDSCRAKHGTKHTFDEVFESHPNCRCIPLPDGMPAALSTLDHSPQPTPTDETFSHTLKELYREFPQIRMVEMRYVKRPIDVREGMRVDFGKSSGPKEKFLRGLVDTQEKQDELLRLGVPQKVIDRMVKDGKTGTSAWQVHHKFPLDDGGTNEEDNFILIEDQPTHKYMTFYQRARTQGMVEGETRVMLFPLPDGNVYTNEMYGEIDEP